MNKIILSGALALVLTLTGCGSYTQTSVSEPAPEETQVATTEKTSTIGETLSNEDFSVTLNSVSYPNRDGFGGKPDNGNFVVIDITIENLSDESETFSVIGGLDLRDAEGYSGDFAIFVKTKGSAGGEVPAGGMSRGQMAFDIGDGPYLLLISPDMFGDSAKFEFSK